MHDLEKIQTHAGRLSSEHFGDWYTRLDSKKMRPRTYVHLSISVVIQQFLEWSKTL